MRARAGWLAGLAALAAAGCSTAVPTETPGVERLGETVLRYSGAEAEMVMSYRFPALNPTEDWLFLDVGITAVKDPVEVDRRNISVRTPAGEEIALATQAEFRAAQGELAPRLARADVIGEPLGYFPAREEKRLELFATPFEGLAFDSFWISYREVYVGRLYFEVPGGVQPGRWELRVKLAESEIRIPFRLAND